MKFKPKKYVKLLKKAQAVTTRKQAQKILKKARKLERIGDPSQLDALRDCCN